MCSPFLSESIPAVPGNSLSHLKQPELESYQLDVDEYLFCT